VPEANKQEHFQVQDSWLKAFAVYVQSYTKWVLKAKKAFESFQQSCN